MARLPRHANAAGALLDYEHCGRTVIVSDGDKGGGGIPASVAARGFWVEGGVAEAGEPCPLRDVSPLTSPFGPGTVLGDLSGTAADAASKAWESLEAAIAEEQAATSDGGGGEAGAPDLARNLGRTLGKLQVAAGGISKAVEAAAKEAKTRLAAAAASPTEMSSLVGIDRRFLEQELAMIESVASGAALEHHLEPSYFAALEIAAAMSLESAEEKSWQVEPTGYAALEGAAGGAAVSSAGAEGVAAGSDGPDVLISLEDVAGAVDRWRDRARSAAQSSIDVDARAD